MPENVPYISIIFLQNRAVMKAIDSYRTCLSKESINAQGDGYLKEVIESLGGSNLTSPNWNSSEYNVEKALITAFIQFGVQPFFSVDLVSDLTNSTTKRFGVCLLHLALWNRILGNKNM